MTARTCLVWGTVTVTVLGASPGAAQQGAPTSGEWRTYGGDLGGDPGNAEV